MSTQEVPDNINLNQIVIKKPALPLVLGLISILGLILLALLGTVIALGYRSDAREASEQLQYSRSISDCRALYQAEISVSLANAISGIFLLPPGETPEDRAENREAARLLALDLQRSSKAYADYVNLDPTPVICPFGT